MRKIIRLSAACAVSLLASVPSAFGEPICKPVNGHFEAVVVPPGQGHCPTHEDPSSPPPFCTAGRIWGGIQGNYRFVVTGAASSALLGGREEIFFFTGKSTIFLKNGDRLLDTDIGSIDRVRGGFASLVTFEGGTSGGTGSMFDATGQIALRGKLDRAAGTTSGDYTGNLCMPEKKS